MTRCRNCKHRYEDHCGAEDDAPCIATYRHPSVAGERLRCDCRGHESKGQS